MKTACILSCNIKLSCFYYTTKRKMLQSEKKCYNLIHDMLRASRFQTNRTYVCIKFDLSSYTLYAYTLCRHTLLQKDFRKFYNLLANGDYYATMSQIRQTSCYSFVHRCDVRFTRRVREQQRVRKRISDIIPPIIEAYFSSHNRNIYFSSIIRLIIDLQE